MTSGERRGGSGPESDARAGRWALGAAVALLVVTWLWWAFALWPAEGSAEWLARARNVCFGVGPSGMPDAGGWILLIGQPLGMAGVLVVGWRRELARAIGDAARRWRGRLVLGGSVVAIVVGVGLASYRVTEMQAAQVVTFADAPVRPEALPRLDRPVPEAVLVDQHGDSIGAAIFEGRTTAVAFAFGNCETICPVVVHRMLVAREELGLTGEELPLVVVTVDPWRDTPARLPHIAEQWELGPLDRVLSGDVEAVERALDAWGVARSRDPLTGDIVHPPLVYLVDPSARVAFASSGDPASLEGLLRRLRTE